MADDKKSELQKREEGLFYKSKNIWEEVEDDTLEEIKTYGDKYKNFLEKAKSERLTVRWIMEEAKKLV